MNLPKEFTNRMQELLRENYKDYIESFSKESFNGLRVNTLKISPQDFETINPFSIEKVLWTSNGYSYKKEELPAKHPYYYAGLYYLQEPSAMLPAAILPVEPGDKVLDLCAAPGGKSTELAAKLKGKGVLVANDISNSRAKALLKNIELFGITNAIVLSENPKKLAERFPHYFDKILIDAPCSGEGMFRKDNSMIKNWESKGVDFYSPIQKEIIDSAVKMLKFGGMLVYSTCTFAPEENESNIQYMLDVTKDMEVLSIDYQKGFSTGRPDWNHGDESLLKCCRLWPFKVNGEGHFAALLKKKGNQEEQKNNRMPFCKADKVSEYFNKMPDFFDFMKQKPDLSLCERRNDKLYLLPQGLPDLNGLRILRSGLLLGEWKKERFEPSQALAMSLTKDQFIQSISFDRNDVRVIKYLKGETIELENSDKKGWQLVCVDGYPLGWGKADQGRLKNKYYAGWRWM